MAGVGHAWRRVVGPDCAGAQRSGRNDDARADSFVRRPGPLVTGGEVCVMLDGRERHESVVHGATRNPRFAQELGYPRRARTIEDERCRKPFVQQARRVNRRQPEVARQAGQNRVCLRERVTTERHFTPTPPPYDLVMRSVRLDEEGNRNARVEP